VSTIDRAPIAADGSLGPFAALPGTLMVARSGAAVTVVANNVYVIGGHGGNADLQSIEHAAITNDGVLGPFSIVGTTLSTGRSGHTATMLGNALYVEGGLGAQGSSGIERSILGADGSLGPFIAAPQASMATLRAGHTNAILGNYLYALGGLNLAGSVLSTVERAAINAGSAIAMFDGNAGPSLQVASQSHTTAVIGNYLYVFGGLGNAGFLSRVERAEIASDGSLRPFATLAETVLSNGRDLHACAVAGNHVYLIGGRVKNAPTPTIDHSAIAADGTLGFIEPASVSLTTSRDGLTAVVIGNHLYVLGGFSGGGTQATVERATIGADGSLGRFSIVPGVNLTGPRTGHTSVVLGNFLYNLGGNSGGGPVLATVERATINQDGSLGPFALVPGVTLTSARAFHTSFVIGSYLYVSGGQGATPELDSVERSPIAVDGSLGPFAPVPGVKLGTARLEATAVVLAGQVYVLGGQGPAGRLTSVERAVLAGGGSP
jgi:N-acetylneuraminic acid mutarotase